MSTQDLKIYLFNGSTFALTFTNLEKGMKIFLLALSIIYTIIQIKNLITKKKDGKN